MDVSFRFPDLTHTLQVTGCHFDHKPPGWSYPRHHHNLFELLYCMEGEILLEIHRDTIRLVEGEWLLMKAGVRHQSSNVSSRPCAFFNIHFDLDDTAVRSKLSAEPYRHISQEKAKRTKLGDHVLKLEEIMDSKAVPGEHLPTSLPVLLARFTFETRLLLQSYTLQLIYEVLVLLKNSVPEPKKPCSRQTTPLAGSKAYLSHTSTQAADVAHAIEEKLMAGLSEDISVANVAREMNLSRSQCSKLFSKVYGQSPRQYISRHKLNQAKELLITTHLPIYAIADKLGFRSASHFSRQFRRWTGQSPTDYRPRS